jgi:hypothetical protein
MAAEALAALNGHERDFPRGTLAEERDALRVQALVAAGEREAAQSRARSFHKRFPQSLLAPTVDEVLAR